MSPGAQVRQPLRVLQLMGHASGGIAGHVASLAEGLAAHGVQVAVATSADSAARLPGGVPGVVVAWPGLRPGRQLRRLRQLFLDADLVHAHGHQAGTLAVTLAAGIPAARRPVVVITWHNALLSRGARRAAGAAMERAQVAGADLLTGASSDLVARARELGSGTARLSEVAAPDLTPWPGSRDQARAELDDLGVPPGTTWVLTVSRIAPQKNLPVLVEAAHRLGRAGEVVWLVVGDGDRELELQLHEQILDTEAPVRLLGVRRDVPRLVAAADLLVLPSQWEARSLVVQEAMAGGLPCVVTDTGGLPDLVGDAGLIVPVGDPDALADAVRRVLDEPGLKAELAERSRRRAAGLPGTEEVLRGWLATYTELTAARRPG